MSSATSEAGDDHLRRAVLGASAIATTPEASAAVGEVEAAPTPTDVERFNEAIRLIRATPEFRQIPDWLRANGVRFALSRWNLTPGTAAEYHPHENRVLLDVDYLQSVRPVLVASLIVHETVHAQRYLEGTFCDPCTPVGRGVTYFYEEELPAYEQQAQFLLYWVDRGVLGELPMTAAYREGPEAFAWYVWRDLWRRGHNASHDSD